MTRNGSGPFRLSSRASSRSRDVDPFHVDRRTTFFAVADADADLAAPARLASRLHGQIGAADAEGIGNRLHGVPSRTGEVARNSRFFGRTRSSASRRISMFEPRIELTQHAGRVGLCADPRVIPFEGFDESFSHAVRLGTLDRCRAGNQPDVPGQGRGSPAV